MRLALLRRQLKVPPDSEDISHRSQELSSKSSLVSDGGPEEMPSYQ